MGGTVRLVRLAGPALFIAGLASLAVAFVQGEATLTLYVIFPVLTATGVWSILGIALMIAGFFVLVLTWSGPVEAPIASPPAAPASAPRPGGRRWGGVVFLGPIPVVFGSDQKITRWMLVVGILLFVALLVSTVIAVRGI